MATDWKLAADIVVPFATLVLGGYLTRRLERKSKIVYYLGHASAFQIQSGPQPFWIHTHSIVVRNAGKKSATNVRIVHNVLPADYNIFPTVPYSIQQLDAGRAEIVLPQMIPNEQLTISYLYHPPLTYGQVNAEIKSDDGFGIGQTVIPQQQFGKLFNAAVTVLILIGLTTLIYFVVKMAIWLAFR